MASASEFLAERLRTEGQKTNEFFANLAADKWAAVVYAEGEEWSARSILAHFVTAENGFLKIFSDIRDGGPGVGEDFDIDRFNTSQQKKTVELSPQALLEQFGEVRGKMVAFVLSLDDADLAKRGRHPYLGVAGLEEMIKLVYRHNQIHIRDIRKAAGEN